MKSILSALVTIFFVTQAQASWSGFAHVTPDSESDFKLKISMNPIEGKSGKYSIKFKAVGYDHKLAWLLISKTPLSSEQQEQLRNCIWRGSKCEKDILVKAKLMPAGIGGFIKEDKLEKFYELELDYHLMQRSYIYIDFPSPVLDGGHYYSIDLGAYYKKLTSNAHEQPLRGNAISHTKI